MTRPVAMLILLSLLGAGYGYVSARENANPYPVSRRTGMPAERIAQIPKGRAWRPSPLWLPAYLVCVVPRYTVENKYAAMYEGIPETTDVVGYGHQSFDGQGYRFTSNVRRDQYTVASMMTGAGLGLLAGGLIGLACGWITVGRKSQG